MKWTAASMLLGLLSLTSCAPSGPVPDTFCSIAKPIYFDWADKVTPRTELAIIKHNETWQALCEKK